MLHDELARQGRFLFRWRGHLPLLLLPLALLAAWQSGAFAEFVGEPLEEAWETLCLAISLAGLAIRIATVGCAPAGTSGRNAQAQRAATLNVTGMYSVVRNPLYLGNFLMLLGLLLLGKAWWLAPLGGLLFALHYERIVCAEERFLEERFGERYRAWAARTPAFLPDLRLWRPAELPFSLRNALRREYNGFFVVIAGFVAVELAGDLLGEGMSFAEWLSEDAHWAALFLTGSAVFLILRTLKRRTSLLRAPGR
jgi:protein-S-isoprenylcysteine O-methyltransferase Ste14